MGDKTKERNEAWQPPISGQYFNSGAYFSLVIEISYIVLFASVGYFGFDSLLNKEYSTTRFFIMSIFVASLLFFGVLTRTLRLLNHIISHSWIKLMILDDRIIVKRKSKYFHYTLHTIQEIVYDGFPGTAAWNNSFYCKIAFIDGNILYVSFIKPGVAKIDTVRRTLGFDLNMKDKFSWRFIPGWNAFKVFQSK